MTADLLDHVQALLAADYQIDRELGRGGMAVVYSAHDRRLARKVAIKVLPPQLAFRAGARERFVREARIAAALDHPGIVPVYVAAVREDIAFFVMALVEGESLARLLARQVRLPITDAQRLLAEVADALSYAHDAGVVHRDIKPGNILIDAATGRPIVTDFGIARALDDETHRTPEGSALGTPAYMAPEQTFGDGNIDGRADIYALGVVGYELLTGRVPFAASSAPALLASHVSDRPVPLLDLRPDAPLSMVAAIDGALEKKPAARWPTASAFRIALGEPPSAVARSASASRFVIREEDSGTWVSPRALARRIRQFRRKAFGSLGLASFLGLLNLAFGASPLFFLAIAGLLAMDLVVMGSALYAEDVPVRDLFASAIRDDTTHGASTVLISHPAPKDARVESLRHGAASDHADIHRMLHAMSDDERALVPSVGVTVDALHQHIQLMVSDLREADLSGTALAQLDRAADAMHVVRLELMNLRDARFEQHLDQFNQLLQDPMK